MKFILYAQTNPAALSSQLGVADYSYTFLLNAFQQSFAELGQTAVFADWEQAVQEANTQLRQGVACSLVAFTPPHKLPSDVSCRTLLVFAWEYPNLPVGTDERSWAGDVRYDWRYGLSTAGSAIALSRHTAQAVKDTMGAHYPVRPIPAPLPSWLSAKDRVPKPIHLKLNAAVADSWQMGLSAEGLEIDPGEDGTPWHEGDADALPEFGAPTSGTEASGPADALGTPPCGWDVPLKQEVEVRLQGPVYTSVLTPAVGRKNWEDLVLGFCWAFRDRPDVTLLLKLTGQDLTRCHHELLMMLSKMSPMRCRVLAIYGYLEQTDYAALIEATTFYVNTSLCEGLCLPLVEFLGSGVPAIAPDNTAMADYIDERLAFVVRSYPGVPTVWPHGDHQVNRTSFHQLDWQSLFEAYRASDELARNEPARYLAMSRAARRQMEHYCGRSTVTRQLAEFLGLPLPEQAAASREAVA